MSRSYIKTNKSSGKSGSDKESKKIANKKYRNRVKQYIENEIIPNIDETSNIYYFNKGPKVYFADMDNRK